MALNILARRNISYPFYKAIRSASEEKSIYEKHEEEARRGPPERVVYGNTYPEWRNQWIKRPGEWKSKLGVFVEKNPTPHLLYAMQKIPDISIPMIREWWADMKELNETKNQRYLPERVQILGPNLAAMHFFTFRGATYRLQDSKDWVEGDPFELKLPDRFVEGYFVEAIDCSKFKKGGIRYEGLANLANLNCLKWLSLKNNSHINVWGLDRIAGQNAISLEYLDISGIQFNSGCVFALLRMSALKTLVITDPKDNVDIQVALSALEQENPGLVVKTVD